MKSGVAQVDLVETTSPELVGNIHCCLLKERTTVPSCKYLTSLTILSSKSSIVARARLQARLLKGARANNEIQDIKLNTTTTS